ncbi:MAG: hypothetical protein U9N49_08155, partial [Campylobacterota bacterium]|nr:hypothetical protein [Campylobacterota bacterium]
MRKIFLMLITISLIWGWEVNTHQALTMKALEKNSANLKHFIDKFDLSNHNYRFETFEYIGDTTYLNYAMNGIGFTDWNIRFLHKDYYLLMIEAGSVVEDSIGRYLFHFYNPQNGGSGLM